MQEETNKDSIKTLLEGLEKRAFDEFQEKFPDKPKPTQVIIIGAGIGESVHRVMTMVDMYHEKGIAVCVPNPDEFKILEKEAMKNSRVTSDSLLNVELPKIELRPNMFEGEFERYIPEPNKKAKHNEKVFKQKFHNNTAKRFNSKGFRGKR